MDVLTVVCFWWFDPHGKANHVYIYGADHVVMLKRMVERHLTVPHEFVCVTDKPEKLPGIRTVKLDRKTWVPGTRYVKLMLWRKDIAEVIGERILYLDLDCVVTRNLDHLVQRDEDVVLWRNPNFGGKRRARYNTSIMLFTAGARPELYETFDPHRHPGELRQKWGGTDQAWISTRCSPEEAYWTDADGVYGAGRLKDIVPGVGTTLPENARIVFFPGSREPGMKTVQQLHPWIKEHRV